MLRTLAGWAAHPTLVRLALFAFLLCSLWLPLAAPLYFLTGQSPTSAGLAAGLLYLFFFAALYIWGRWVRGRLQPFAACGLTWNPHSLALALSGFVFALVSLGMLFALENWLGWLRFEVSSQINWALVGLNGLALGVGVALAEELLFRGWLVNELVQDCGLLGAITGSSFLYALLHFLKPLEVILASWPQFPGLYLLGLILVGLRLAAGGPLALPIGLHAGWVCGITLVNASGLVHYTGTTSELTTGLGGNPLAGSAGLGFLLLILGLVLTRLSQQSHNWLKAGRERVGWDSMP